MATVLVLASSSLHAEDESYHRRFSELLSQGTRGFIFDISLVDTNNFGPVLTNGAVPFSLFSQKGELAGIKLGMSMAEVVKAWGKPRLLFTHCQIGPRLYYGQRVSLFFRVDRLVLIAIDGRLVGQAVFDNGLNVTMGRKQVEGLLGTPSLRIAKQSRIYEGDIAYVVGPIRTDFSFRSISLTKPSLGHTEELLWAAVAIQGEVVSNKSDPPLSPVGQQTK